MSEDANRTDKPQAEGRLSLLWRRVKEHRIAQWTVGYVAVAYGIQHAVILTSESYEWPNAIARVSMTLLALGLPIAMTLAWYHGGRANRRISGPELSIISILLVIGAGLFYVFARPSEQIAAGPASKTQAAAIAGPPGSAITSGISIAVLPFANVSGDASQEFFSDGMTDEIIAALAKVPSLQVVARTSAFQFKGEKKDMRAIGQALNARYLIDGSVRKAGMRVRITAQLVQADNGVGVWTASYDRELKDIFATQSDIAEAIAGALKVPLGLAQGDSLVGNRTKDEATYEDYLRAKALFRARAGGNNSAAIVVLEKLLTLDPDFAPAWALLSRASLTGLGDDRIPVEEARRTVRSILDRAEIPARKAIQLNPNYAGGYWALAANQFLRGKWTEAADLYGQALKLDANDPDILQGYVRMLQTVGRLKEASAISEKSQTLEPFVPAYILDAVDLMQINGQYAASIGKLAAIVPDANLDVIRNLLLSRADAALGRYSEAADVLLAMRQDQRFVSRQSVEDAARLLRTAPATTERRDAVPKLDGPLQFVYAHVGALPRVMEYPERLVENGQVNSEIAYPLWGPASAPLRKTERFKAFVRKAGLVDYWKAKGWPDLCRPMGADDFVCD